MIEGTEGKEITEGKFVIQEAIQQTPMGNRKINLFSNVCKECLEKHTQLVGIGEVTIPIQQ